jgi:hypothetical protein
LLEMFNFVSAETRVFGTNHCTLDVFFLLYDS